MSALRVRSSSSSDRNGRGLTSSTSPHDTTTPTAPPAIVVATPSSRNCSRMAPRRAPSALRMPISRVRSVTETNMMFITPTPPMASVSTPMNVEHQLQPEGDALGDLGGLRRAEEPQRPLVGRVEAQALAERLLHLPRSPASSVDASTAW